MTVVSAMTFYLSSSQLLRARASAQSFDPHLHATHSIVVLMKGSADIHSRRWQRTVNAGEIFFLNPLEVHAGTCKKGAADYEVFYPSAVFMEQLVDTGELHSPLFIQTAVLGSTPETRILIDALASADCEDEEIESALGGVLRTCAIAAPPPSQTVAGIVLLACSIIAKGRGRQIPTKDIAEEIGVHESHLIRAFTASIGIAPQTYIRQLRVAKARELIGGGLSLSATAQALDFSDQAHLTREFKKVFGVPPGALSREAALRRH